MIATEQLNSIPQLLKDLPNWVRWQMVNGSKVPFVCGDSAHASSTDPTTWSDFTAATQNATINDTEGIGFVIGGDAATTYHIVGFDLDGCINAATSEVASWAEEILNRFDKNSYTEYTPSGNGLRVWVRGVLPGTDRVFNLDPKVGFGSKVKIEVFDHARYFTITGDSFFETPDDIEEQDLSDVYKLCQQLRDRFPAPSNAKQPSSSEPGTSAQIQRTGNIITSKIELLLHGALASETPLIVADNNGNSITYPSHSEADLALCTALALAGRDAEAIDAEFRASPLMRDKWNRDDYRASTISKALETASKMKLELNQQPTEQSQPNLGENLGFEHDLTPEEYETQLEQEWPVIPLKPKAGPEWTDDIYYGFAGAIIKKASKYNEAHPAGMLLDLLVSLGSIFAHGPYFNINSTKHHANEFLARVGDSAYSRKGGGRDEIDRLLKLADYKWFTNRTIGGFGSGEAVIDQVRDAFQQQRFDSRTNTFKTVLVPGVDDKRLCIREAELASVFVLAGKADSRADIVMRDGWDSKPLKNVVKGKSQQGISNSLSCQEPHLSISGDTTRHELVSKMPDGADENGFGNRFLYCYVYRTQLCPLGGPEIDWSQEVIKLLDVITYASEQGCIGLTASAKTTWMRMYIQLENNHLPGMAGKMTSRAAAHIRRLALIYALIDMAPAVDTVHLRAAERLWIYCEDSAQFIFNKTTKGQLEILRWFEKRESATAAIVREELFSRNKKASWIKAELDELSRIGRLQLTDGTYKIKK